MTSRRSQLQEDTYFRVLRMLQDNPDMTQREIAEKLGISTSAPKATQIPPVMATSNSPT